MNGARVRPWRSIVARMTPNVVATMSSRLGNGAPSAVIVGRASAVTSESPPRIPIHASNATLLGGGIFASTNARAQQPRQIGARKHPHEAEDYDRTRDDRR